MKILEQKAPNAECRTHAIDFGTSDLKKYDEISQIFFGLDVGILINNVGFDFEIPEKFLEFPGGMESIQHMINVNCLAATLVRRKILEDWNETFYLYLKIFPFLKNFENFLKNFNILYFLDDKNYSSINGKKKQRSFAFPQFCHQYRPLPVLQHLFRDKSMLEKHYRKIWFFLPPTQINWALPWDNKGSIS